MLGERNKMDDDIDLSQPDKVPEWARREASFAATHGSARFLVQRPEYPGWWAGWNEYNMPLWTSQSGYAYLVRFDELVDTLTRLKKHKPIAALYSPNDQAQRPERKGTDE
jgi:hypothetical protein